MTWSCEDNFVLGGRAGGGGGMSSSPVTVEVEELRVEFGEGLCSLYGRTSPALELEAKNLYNGSEPDQIKGGRGSYFILCIK